jgi:hypothetical protein
MEQPACPAPDWHHWLARDLWTIEEAVALSLNIDPARLGPGNVVRLPSKIATVMLLPVEFADRLGVARSSKGMSLPVRARPHGDRVEEHVEPGHFAAWLRQKGLSVPPELQHLAAADATSSAPALLPVAKPTSGTSGRKPGKRGRKTGSGSIDDSGRLRAMLRFLAAGVAPSVLDAARRVAESIMESSQSREADTARLRGKFAKYHGTEPPTGKTWADVEAELKDN